MSIKVILPDGFDWKVHTREHRYFKPSPEPQLLTRAAYDAAKTAGVKMELAKGEKDPDKDISEAKK